MGRKEIPVTDRTIAQQYRLHHVRMFHTSGLSQRAYCRLPYTPTRNTLAAWLKAYADQGPQALLSRKPKRCPHNRTTLQDEAIILEFVKLRPAPGALTIANELRGRIAVGHTGVHGVLTRHGLNKRRDRQEWTRVQWGQIVTKTELQTARERAKTRHFDVSYPGECWGQDTFLVGRIKGIGAVYHNLAVDLASSYAVVKLYTARNAHNACDFVEHHLVPKAKNLGIHRLLQDNGTEFTAARWRDDQGRCNHPFHQLAKRLHIRLNFIKPRHPWTNGCCERLHQTLLHEFYQPAMCRKIYTSLEELEYDLQLFMHWYNFQRTHQGHRLKGRRPADVYLSGKTPSPHRHFNIAL